MISVGTNANAANALDLDDDAIYTRGHPGAQLFPAALAIAEKVGTGCKIAQNGKFSFLFASEG